MAKRKFNLPGAEDLNKDQDKVLRLPENGQFLIVGGPGTGKSVVALLRALKFHPNKDYRFLTYNHVLNEATAQLINVDLISTTLQSWFYKLQYHYTKEFMPELEKHKVNYEEVIRRFEAFNFSPKTIHLIIDEGQDMPVKYYESLMCAGIENFFIVADQNQQITDENSSRSELTDLLGLEVPDVIELQSNYRNSYPIAELSQYFFTDPSSPLPELPDHSKQALGTPILYEGSSVERYSKLILNEFDKDDRNLIGVITPNDEIRGDYFKSLEVTEVERDNAKPIISTYTSKEKSAVSIDFGEGGIVVLNDKSVKGVEFDIVYIVLDGLRIYNSDIDSIKKRLYVMCSRAIKKLVFIKQYEFTEEMKEIIPNDEKILKRLRLNDG